MPLPSPFLGAPPPPWGLPWAGSDPRLPTCGSVWSPEAGCPRTVLAGQAGVQASSGLCI